MRRCVFRTLSNIYDGAFDLLFFAKSSFVDVWQASKNTSDGGRTFLRFKGIITHIICQTYGNAHSDVLDFHVEVLVLVESKNMQIFWKQKIVLGLNKKNKSWISRTISVKKSFSSRVILFSFFWNNIKITRQWVVKSIFSKTQKNC